VSRALGARLSGLARMTIQHDSRKEEFTSPRNSNQKSERQVFRLFAVSLAASLCIAALALGFHLDNASAAPINLHAIAASSPSTMFSNEYIQDLFRTVESMGTSGQFLYGLTYFLLELVAVVPALPLTLGAGYLFGVVKGTTIVSISSTMAAAISFLMARYGLRSRVSKLASNYPVFRKLDRAIGKQGFKIVFLLRMSPLLPFAISNYLYGLTAISFGPYLLASWIGMLPGSVAYVLGGAAGRELGNVTSGDMSGSRPLLVLGAIATISSLFVIGKIATDAIQSVEDEDSAADLAANDGGSPDNSHLQKPVDQEAKKQHDRTPLTPPR